VLFKVGGKAWTKERDEPEVQRAWREVFEIGGLGLSPEPVQTVHDRNEPFHEDSPPTPKYKDCWQHALHCCVKTRIFS
jgi:hypothetical protein